MKKTTTVETTVVYTLTPQDIRGWLSDKGLIPEGWEWFSIDVQGLGKADGMTITLKNSNSPKP